MLDLIVFIGRFQPFHNGHREVLSEALRKAKEVLILVGSSGQARSYKNPWTFEERKGFIEETLTKSASKKVKILPLRDYPLDDTKWAVEVRSAVSYCGYGDKGNVGIIGHEKDSSSYYLRMFPDWKQIFLPNMGDISATDIRRDFFINRYISYMLPVEIRECIVDFFAHKDFPMLEKEFFEIENYKGLWKDSPFPPTFITTDAVVFKGKDVLLIKRKDSPGKGLLALPGGFLNQDETLLQCALRELREETGLTLSQGDVLFSRVIDNPSRSERGRTVTHVYCMEVDEDRQGDLCAGDDASEAYWWNILELREEDFYQDHYHIIMEMFKKIAIKIAYQQSKGLL